MKKQNCPECNQSVEVRHNGEEQINDRTSPWIFVDHLRNDQRGDTVFRNPCPGGGKNDWTAANSM
ncbi:hypothetical protein [Rhodococcus opacus]|uniref:Uncharacterized protein n=1 Tax=Rhodococcus opacus TaxID=37919 RepID=A0A2S8JAW2_RHOOP|nr:hypothetical protein [Rhodococcus opacus]PQP24181.1 hypothetical protein C5613_14975 [Rhodococcus opacus]